MRKPRLSELEYIFPKSLSYKLVHAARFSDPKELSTPLPTFNLPNFLSPDFNKHILSYVPGAGLEANDTAVSNPAGIQVSRNYPGEWESIITGDCRNKWRVADWNKSYDRKVGGAMVRETWGSGESSWEDHSRQRTQQL